MQFLTSSPKSITINQIEQQLHGFGREIMLSAHDLDSSLKSYRQLDPDENVGKTVMIELAEPIIDSINIIKGIRELEDEIQVMPAAILAIIDYSSVNQEVLAKMAGSNGFLPLSPTRQDIVKELDRILGPNSLVEIV